MSRKTMEGSRSARYLLTGWLTGCTRRVAITTASRYPSKYHHLPSSFLFPLALSKGRQTRERDTHTGIVMILLFKLPMNFYADLIIKYLLPTPTHSTHRSKFLLDSPFPCCSPFAHMYPLFVPL